MKNLLNFLVFILINVLATHMIYGHRAHPRLRAQLPNPKCLGSYQEPAEPCLLYMKRYYYDKANNKCIYVFYGECAHDPNNFVSKKECEKACVIQPKIELPEVPEHTRLRALVPSSKCLVPYQPSSVSCLAFMPRFYYDIAINECIFFVYGGCGGNINNFDSKEECEQSCVIRPMIEPKFAVKPAVCSEPILWHSNSRDCPWFWIKYGFDTLNNECVTFMGCKENGNNFDTIDDCEETCML